jgi:hypothetical protein
MPRASLSSRRSLAKVRHSSAQRFIDSRGECAEVAADLDIVLETGNVHRARRMKVLASRVSAMLTRLIPRLEESLPLPTSDVRVGERVKRARVCSCLVAGGSWAWSVIPTLQLSRRSGLNVRSAGAHRTWSVVRTPSKNVAASLRRFRSCVPETHASAMRCDPVTRRLRYEKHLSVRPLTPSASSTLRRCTIAERRS